MITKELPGYAEKNWDEFKESVAELSKSDGTGIPLVERNELLYNFDKISLSMYEKSKAPTSADAVMITPKCVSFIEFKSGFKQRITKNNFDEEKARCKDAGRVCKQYWALFFKNQKKEIQELIASIRMKALESYITLEKKILPKCCQADRKIGLKFMVIIDEDEVDNMEDTLAALAGGTQVKGNHFSEIRRALERMMVQRDADGNEYYYDDIKVWSARDFENYLRLNGENG